MTYKQDHVQYTAITWDCGDCAGISYNTTTLQVLEYTGFKRKWWEFWKPKFRMVCWLDRSLNRHIKSYEVCEYE